MNIRLLKIRVFESCRGHHYEETWLRSSPSSIARVPRDKHVSAGNRIRVPCVANRNSNSLCCYYSEPVHGCPIVHGTHTLCKERKLICKITRISIQLLYPNSTYKWHTMKRLLQILMFESRRGHHVWGDVTKGNPHPLLHPEKTSLGRESNPGLRRALEKKIEQRAIRTASAVAVSYGSMGQG